LFVILFFGRIVCYFNILLICYDVYIFNQKNMEGQIVHVHEIPRFCSQLSTCPIIIIKVKQQWSLSVLSNMDFRYNY